jgi:H+/Cl- antiporter ClcA
MRADVSFSPSPALWVILAVVVVGTLAGWFWVRRPRASERGVGEACGVLSHRRRDGERPPFRMVR